MSKSGGKGVLVSGIQDKNAQLLVLAINQVLKSESFTTLGTRQIRKGSNQKVAQLIADMNAGSVHTLIMSGVNPVYTLEVSFVYSSLSVYVTGLTLTTLARDPLARSVIFSFLR